MLPVSLFVTALGFVVPNAPRVAHTPRSAAPVALLDATTMLASVAQLPPEFADAAAAMHGSMQPQAHGHRFSDYLMSAVGGYIMVSAACTLGPRVWLKLRGKIPSDPMERMQQFLREQTQESSFGWLHGVRPPPRAQR